MITHISQPDRIGAELALGREECLGLLQRVAGQGGLYSLVLLVVKRRQLHDQLGLLESGHKTLGEVAPGLPLLFELDRVLFRGRHFQVWNSVKKFCWLISEKWD